MKDIAKNKKGFTLIEIIIALGIFALVSLLVVDIFVELMRYYIGSISNRKAQQNTKIAMETVTRYAKQALVADWNDTNEILTLKTKDDSGASHTIIFDKETTASPRSSLINMKVDSGDLQPLTSDEVYISRFDIAYHPGVPVIITIDIEAEVLGGKNFETGASGVNLIKFNTSVAIKGQYNY
jgi:prepilin-type N-terminal cleavage/methylation domain-containing protein